jgi:hypothetical protein
MANQIMRLRNVEVIKDTEYKYQIEWRDGEHFMRLTWGTDSDEVGCQYTNSRINCVLATSNYASVTDPKPQASFAPNYDGAQYAARWFLENRVKPFFEREEQKLAEARKKREYQIQLAQHEKQKARQAHRAKLKGGSGHEYGEPKPLFNLPSLTV